MFNFRIENLSTPGNGRAGSPGRVRSLRSIVFRKTASVSFIVLTLLVMTAGVLLADYLGTHVNRIFLDPESLPVVIDGYDDGDVISYILEQTPDANSGSTLGSAAWMTVYIPDGVEVVGAEFVSPSSDGTYAAIQAEDTAAIADGCGGRGCSFPTSGTLQNGKLNEGQQDTGIFYSTDSRTQLLTTAVDVDPTGTGPEVAYNQWDADQVKAFGEDPNLVGGSEEGKGTTPVVQKPDGLWYGTGSPIAGPDTYFTNDYNPACDASATVELDLHCEGPWQRIQYDNSKIGGSTDVLPTTIDPGSNVNTSVDTSAGHVLSTSNALPSGVNAVRYTFGFRRVGDIEQARITYRITDAAAFEASIFGDNSEFCLDGTGSDTDKPDRGVQDNPWRYYEGSTHKCFTGDADGVLLKQAKYVDDVADNGTSLEVGEVIGYEIHFTNNSGNTLYDIDLSDDATLNIDLVTNPAAEPRCAYDDYSGDRGAGANEPAINTISASAATWNRLDQLAAGETVTVYMCATVTGTVGDQVENTATVAFATADGGDQVTQTSIAVGTITSRISGTVYDDHDDSGTLTPGDTGIPSVQVSLYIDVNNDGKLDDDDIFQTTVTTNDLGQYQFNGLDAETYIVVESDPSGYGSTGDIDSVPPVDCGIDDQCNVIQVVLSDGEHNEGNDFFDSNTTVPVSLSYFYAERSDDGLVSFTWETATETGNAGFNLYAEVDGNLNVVNGEMIPSTVIDSVETVYYSYQANLTGEVFYIEMIDIFGQGERNGPFVLGEKYGQSSDSGTPNGGAMLNSLYLPLMAR